MISIFQMTFFFFFSVSRWTLAWMLFWALCHITTWQIQCHNRIENTLLCFYNLCCLAWAWYNLSQFGFTVTFVRSLQWVRATQIEGKLIHTCCHCLKSCPTGNTIIATTIDRFPFCYRWEVSNWHGHNIYF